MAPVAKEGALLARFVLSIAAGAIGVLVIYLAWMDARIASDVAGAYKQVLNPSRIGSEFYTLDRLAHFSDDLILARTNPNQTMTSEAVRRDQDIAKMLGELPSLTSTQKAQLNQCVPLPVDSSRNDKLDKCVAIIEAVRPAALEAATGITNTQLAGEAATKINEHRQNLHTFWIQAAQLILLNLLLPLLTALFGYIFGTQQAAARTP